MSITFDDALLQFTWTPQPAAAAVIRELTDTFCTTNTRAQALATKMRDQTGTRFIDWVDHLVVPVVSNQQADVLRWAEAGFEQMWIDGEPCYVHNGGIFPTLRTGTDTTVTQLAICVDSVADFAAIHELDNIEGGPSARYRRALITREGDTEFYAVERHGYTGFRITATVPEVVVLVSKHRDIFRTRLRALGNDEAGFAHVERLVTNAINEIGQERTCDLFFAAEREYWQRRNRAARVQYARQAALGLGWGNDDHHTYRSSRRYFKRLIALFETLGFFCRERFYAGPEAGWGAQVLEHPTTGIVIFADVDMSPGELRGDFSHEGLTVRDQLGTIGLWCALHGESILEAGMHHLECTFDHALLREQLATEHVETMDPFTSFPYLQQAFTRGEIWPVREARIDTLLAAGQITDEQAERFRTHGTLGSHLENLERNDGFKGFNQAGVNEIITNTDPRRHLIHAGA